MNRHFLLLSLVLAWCLCLATAPAATVTWISTTGGNWSNPANWSPNQVPGSSDTAVITASGNYTVTLDETANVVGLILGANDGNTQTLQFNGQTLNLIQQITVNPGGLVDLSGGILNGYAFAGGAIINGTLACSGGSLAGVLTLASNSVLCLSAVPQQPIYFDETTFTNYGTVIWTNSDLNGEDAPQIYNYGLWLAASNNTFYGGSDGGTSFGNYGIFRKTGGPFVGSGNDYTLLDNTIFGNWGLVDIQTGNLQLEGYAFAGGTLNFGISSPANFGGISFDNSVSLTGSLSVNFNNGFSPAAGDSFPLVNVYPTGTGTFANLHLPSLPPPLSWQPDYNSSPGNFFALNIVSSPPPQLSAPINVSGNSVSFSWNGLLGQTYQAQYTTNLAPADWMDLGSPILGTNGPVTVSDAPGAPQKFYRVQEQ